MTKENEQKFPHIIPNEPIGEDQFEGGSQNRIADSIVAFIKNKHESCQMIGIDGGWGSGKSNLVGIINKKLEDKSQNGNLGESYHFFTYDAWGHQGDLHRRAFLEELIIDLKKSQILSNSPNNCEVELKKILGSTVEVDKTIVPKVSCGLAGILVALLITPLSKVLTDMVSCWFFKVLFGIIPPLIILIVICIYYRKMPKYDTIGNKKTFALKMSEVLCEIVSIYNNKELQSSSVITTHEENPSVNKFRQFIQKVVENIKANNRSQNLVIVFDNLDRLPCDEVKMLWSSIHTFFAEANKYDNLNVIVPFDREHIQNAFKNEDCTPDNGNVNSADSGKKCYSDDFINKTFDVVYRVSPPVLSDWKNYFRLKWNEAFDNMIEDCEITRVVQIYDVLTPQITPRDIIAFINECVTIKLSNAVGIPVRYIALFIKGKRKILADPMIELATPSYLKGLEYIYSKDEELPKYLAAIVYQLPYEGIISAVYAKQLKDSLDNAETDKIKTISKINSFFDILENVISDISNIGNAILALNVVPKESFINDENYRLAWNSLYMKIEQNADESVELKDYQKILLSHISERFVRLYIDKLLIVFRNSKDYKSSIYTTNIDYFKNKYPNINVLDKLENKRATPDDFILFVAEKESDYVHYRISCEQTELDEYLSKKTIDELADMHFIKYLFGEYKLLKYKTLICQLYQSSISEQNVDHINKIIDRVKELDEEVQMQDINKSSLDNIFTGIDETNKIYYDIIAAMLAKHLNINSYYSNKFVNLFSSNDAQLCEKISDGLYPIIEKYIQFGNLLLWLEDYSQYPVYKILCKKVVDKQLNTHSKANIMLLLSKFDRICALGELEPGRLLTRLSAWSSYFKDVPLEEVPNQLPLGLLKATRELTNNKLSMKICNLENEYLNSLSKDEWTNALNSDLNTYAIGAGLAIRYKWKLAATEAIKQYLRLIASGKISQVPNKEQWNILISNLDNTGVHLRAAFDNVRDDLRNRANTTVPLFLFFADWLFKYASLNDRKDVLRTIFPETLLHDDKCVNIMLVNKEQMRNIIDKAKDEAVDFKSILIELAGDKTNSDIIDLANYCGLLPENNSNLQSKDIDESSTDSSGA